MVMIIITLLGLRARPASLIRHSAQMQFGLNEHSSSDQSGDASWILWNQ